MMPVDRRPHTLPEARPICRQCRRPTSVCYCAHLTQLDTTTRVVILQHPRERDMAIGTARMASLCLPAAALHVGIDWSEHGPLAAALADPTRTPILLYPGTGARDVLRDPPRGPVTLVVVDGTWSQAKSVVRDNPILRELPRYAFFAPEPSEYRIRREPDIGYCSTIEALMHVLGALECDPMKFRALLTPFRAMVDAQLARKATELNPRMRSPRPPRAPCDRLPSEIRDRFDDLVVVSAEANAWRYREANQHPADQLVHWIAHRPSTGGTFEAIVAPTGPLSPSTGFHTRLSDDVLAAGMSRAQLLAAYAKFARPADVMCAWGHYGPRLFIDSGGP
jgi:DTW domain-containing protein